MSSYSERPGLFDRLSLWFSCHVRGHHHWMAEVRLDAARARLPVVRLGCALCDKKQFVHVNRVMDINQPESKTDEKSAEAKKPFFKLVD